MNTQYYRLGLIGHNIGHSLSPEIFRLFFEQSGLQGEMVIYDFPPNELPDRIAELRDLAGFSITIPYKNKIIDYLDDLDNKANLIKAVNCIQIFQSRMVGYNTDINGFASTMTDWPEKVSTILILGHGGAARAVITAIVAQYPKVRLIICGRDRKRIELFCGAMRGAFKGLDISGMTCQTLPLGLSADVIINTTPLGDINHIDKMLLPSRFGFDKRPFCYDLVYRPSKTLFLKNAAAQGCRYKNGLGMLAAQAAESFLLWTGKTVGPEKTLKLLPE